MRLILTLIVLATLGMVGFIWYRWHGVREPTTAIIIRGDQSLEGTSITIRGMNRVITTSLNAEDDFVAPVLLEPGRYLVTAEHEGELLLRKLVEVRRFLGVRFDLVEYLRVEGPDGARQRPGGSPADQTDAEDDVSEDAAGPEEESGPSSTAGSP